MKVNEFYGILQPKYYPAYIRSDEFLDYHYFWLDDEWFVESIFGTFDNKLIQPPILKNKRISEDLKKIYNYKGKFYKEYLKNIEHTD